MANDGMDYKGFSHQESMESFDDFILEDDLFLNPNPILSEIYSTAPYNFNSTSNLSYNYTIEENEQKALNMTSPPSSSSSSSSSEVLISFSTPSTTSVKTSQRDLVGKSYSLDSLTYHMMSHVSEENNNTCQESSGNNNMYKRDSSQAGDHAILERKRRQKLTQLFVSLSKVIPGLKKLDKASLLGDTIQYMKELQQRVKVLEEEIEKNSSKKASACGNVKDVTSLSKKSDYGSNEEVVPEINVRVFGKSALINIYCNKQSGVVGRILSEMETLHLSIRDINIMSFGPTSLDISIVAEMENSATCENVEDIVKDLQSKLRPCVFS